MELVELEGSENQLIRAFVNSVTYDSNRPAELKFYPESGKDLAMISSEEDSFLANLLPDTGINLHMERSQMESLDLENLQISRSTLESDEVIYDVFSVVSSQPNIHVNYYYKLGTETPSVVEIRYDKK